MQTQLSRPTASASAKTSSVRSRSATSSSLDHQRRREVVCRVLSQVYVRAERVRTAQRRQNQLRRRAEARYPSESNSGGEESEYDASLSLIELIQASYAVFQRYGITEPDDAVYHRYLLSLSVDPEPDWRKKIRSFDLSHQPRIRRLCGDSVAPKDGERQLQMMATTFEQWRAMQAVKRLVKQNKLRDLQLQQQLLPPQCVHAVFRWIARCLPEKRTFEMAENCQSLPLFVLRRVSVQSGASLEALQRASHGVELWQAKLLLDAWHADARNLRNFRVRMIVKRRAVALEVAFQCIQRWRFFTEGRKCSTDRASWISQRRSRDQLRRCLEQWRRQFQEQAQQHEATKLYGKRLGCRCLVAWRHAVGTRRSLRRRYQVAVKQRVVARWKRRLVGQQTLRAFYRLARNQRRSRLLRDSWRRLQAFATQEQVLRAKMEQFEQNSRRRRMCQVLGGWWALVVDNSELRVREQRFHQHTQRRRLRQVLAAWTVWTERRCALATTLVEATETRAARQLSRAFAGWKAHFATASEAEERMFERVWRMRQQRIWTLWRKHLGVTSAIRGLDDAHCVHVLRVVFTQWKEHTERQVARRYAFLECQHRHERRSLHRSWQALTLNVRSQQLKQSAAETASDRKRLERKRGYFLGWQAHVSTAKETRMRGDIVRGSVRRPQLLRTAWASWRKVFWQWRVVHLADKQLSSYRTTHAFRAWTQLRLEAKQRRKRAMEVVAVLCSFRLGMRFRQWRVFVARKGRLDGQFERALETRCRRALQVRWDAWRQALKKQRDQHAKLVEVVSQWQGRQLRGSFQSWKTRWVLRKRHRRLLHTMFTASREKLLGANFTAWKAFQRAAAAQERRIQGAQAALLQSKAKRAIRRWNMRRIKQRERGRLLRASMLLWRQARVVAVFQSLVTYTRWRKQRTTYRCRARELFQRKLLHRTLAAWLKWRQHKAQIERTFQSTANAISARKVARSVRQLRANAQTHRQLKSAHTCAIAMHTDRAKIDGFSRWAAFVAQRVRKKQAQTVRETAMRCFRMQRGLQQWQRYLCMRKLAQQTLLRATTASRSSQLQQHFTCWKQFTRRSVFVKVLQQKATAFRYFCLLPLHFKAWRAFVGATKHKQELLLRARGLWCHQSERRAFTSWTRFTVTSQQTKRAVAKWRNQAAAKCFASWRCFEVQQKQRELAQTRAEVFHERRTAQQALKIWYATTRSTRLSRRCVALWRQRTSRALFDTWLRHVKLLQSGRRLLLMMKNRTLARVFTSWKESLQRKAEHVQGIQERFTLLWRADRRETYWARWRRFTRLRVVLKRALGSQRTRKLDEILKTWHATVTRRQTTRLAALDVAARTSLQLQRAFWVHWRTQRHLRQCVVALRGKVVENRLASDLRQRFTRWQKFTARALTVERFVRSRDLALLRLVFTGGFYGFVLLQYKERELARQLGSLRDAFLCEWLSTKVLQRMTIVQACEDMRRSKSCKRLVTVAWRAWVALHAKKQAQQAAVRHVRWQVAQLDSWRENQPHDAFTTILRRWKSIQTVRCFERWRLVALAQRQARHHAIAAIDWWHRTQCSRYFASWTNFCRRRRLQRRIRTMGTYCKLKCVWKRWIVFKRTESHRKELTQRARKHHWQHVGARAVVTWREAATALRAERDLVLELYEASRVRLLAALMHEWREFAAEKRTQRIQSAVARVVYAEKLTRRCFVEWQANVASVCQHRQVLQANTERLQVLLLCSCFRAWVAWNQQQHKLHGILQALASKCDSRTASQVLTGWHLHAAKTSRLRHQATAFLRFRSLHRGVAALRAAVQDEHKRVLINNKAQLFRDVLASQSLESVFKRWRAFATLSRKTRVVTLQYLQGKLLPNAWSVWVAHVRRRRLRNGRVAVAAKCWTNVLLRRAWNSMALFHRLESAGRQALELADQHHAAFHLRRAVRQWHGFSQETRHLTVVCRQLLVRWRMQTAYRCFCAWHEQAARSKATEVTAAIVKLRVRDAMALRAWYAWRKLFLVLRSGNRRLLERCWTAWRQSRASRLVLLGFQQQIETQMLRSSQRRRLGLWKQFVAQRKMERAMTLLSSTFAGSRRLRRAWDGWRTSVTRSRVSKTRLRHALAFWTRALQAQALRGWQSAVLEAASRRRKLVYYVTALQCSLQRKSFASWRVFVAHRVALRVKTAQALALRSQLCSHAALEAWRTFVDQARQQKRATQFWAARTLARAVRSWRRGLLLAKVERMLGASAQRHVETSFLSWRKALAKTQQLRAFRAKACGRQRTQQLMTVWQAWRHWSRLQARCRALLTRAAAGNHLRFRFTLWRSFTTQRKRLALLVYASERSVSPDGTLESTSTTSKELVAVAHALARKARVLQRLDVTWDLPETWRRWRLAFHAQLFYRLRRLQARFVAWQQFALRRRRSRWIVLKLTRQRHAAGARDVFRAWAELVARVKQLQLARRRERELWGLVSTELVRRERRSLRSHWHAWQSHVEQARHLQASLQAYYRARLVTSAWLAWRHDFHRLVAEQRRQDALVATGMRSFRLRRALRRLRTHQQRHKRLRLVLEYFGHRTLDRLLPAVLTHWRRRTQRQKQLRQRHTAVQAQRLARHVAAWKTWSGARRRQHRVVNCLQHKRQADARRAAWLAWRRYVVRRVARLDALQSAMAFHARRRLRGRWLRHTQRVVALRERSEAAQWQLEELRVRRGVARWRGWSRERVLRRLYERFTLRKHLHCWRTGVKQALATRFHVLMLRYRAAKLLAAWAHVARRRCYWRQLCLGFLAQQDEQSARRALQQLQRYARARQDQRMADEHATQSAKRDALRHWREATQRRQQSREHRLETAVEHEARVLLRQHVAKWRRAVEKQRQRRFVLLSCVVKLQALSDLRVLEVAHCAWRQLVQRSRRSRAASIKRECSIATRAIATWLAWTRGRQRSREQMHDAATYHAQRLESAVFFYWQTYALAWQDAAKPMARRQARRLSLAVLTAERAGRSDSDSESDADVRRPLSPVAKRLRQQKAKRPRGQDEEAQSEIPTLPEAAQLSMDVKKRLLALGKWRPPQKSLLPTSAAT